MKNLMLRTCTGIAFVALVVASVLLGGVAQRVSCVCLHRLV